MRPSGKFNPQRLRPLPAAAPSRFEERRRFGRLEGVGSALGDDLPFAAFPCLLADLPGWHAIVRKRLKE
jgi:hypothetical protein